MRSIYLFNADTVDCFWVLAGPGVKRVFEFRWKACSPGFQHQPKFLNVAQIIPQNRK